MRKTASLLIVIGCLLMSACSRSVDFVIVNESDSPIVIEYKLEMKSYMSTGTEPRTPPSPLTPARVKLIVWDRTPSSEDWQTKVPDEYKFEGTLEEFRVTILPREAVRIISTNDAVFSEDGYKHFPLTKLEIVGPTGQMSFEGFQLFEQFSEKTYSTRFITYKGKPGEGERLR